MKIIRCAIFVLLCLMFVFKTNPVCAAVNSAVGSLDAGGFAGESFTWDYSFYLDGIVSISSNDSSHISWNGLIATINYPDAGDRTVNFTLRTASGATIGDSGRIRIVEKQGWMEKPRINYNPDFIRNEFRDGEVVDWAENEAALNALNMNTIGFSCNSMCGSGSDFENLLKNTSLKVWPILISYSYETGVQPPYGTDYEAWAGYFANLSLTHENLQAFIIDDFYINDSGKEAGLSSSDNITRKFSASYIRKIIQAKNRINPNLAFIPTFYVGNSVQMQLFNQGNPFKSVLTEGASFWDYATMNGAVRQSRFDQYLRDAAQTVYPVPYISGIYPIAYDNEGTDIFYSVGNDSEHNSLNSLNDQISTAAKKSDGVGLFNVPLWAHRMNIDPSDAIFRQTPNDDPENFDYLLKLGYAMSTIPGWYQAVAANFNYSGSVLSANISFSIKDSLSDSSTKGFHFKQLLINGRVVEDFDIDAAGDGNLADSKNIDIASYLVSGSNQIAIRVFDKRGVGNYPVKVYIGDIRIAVNGKPIAADWKFNSSINSAYVNLFKKAFTDSANSIASFMPPQISFSGVTPADGATSSGSAEIRVAVNNRRFSPYLTALLDWDKSLAGWWRFNDEAAETADFFRDWSSYKNNCFCSAADCPTNTVAGKFGSALQFNGANAAVCANSASLNIAGPITVEAWVKFTGNPQYNERIVDKGITGNNYGYLLFVRQYSQHIGFGSSGGYIETKTSWGDNSWHHIAGVYGGAGGFEGLKIYVDGVQQETVSDGVFTGFSLTSEPLGIGTGSANGSLGNPFVGLIDEVRIYRRPLSFAEIKSSYNASQNPLIVQFSSLANESHNYQAYVQDASGNTASTEKRILAAYTSSCQNQCSIDSKQCAGNGYQTCGDFNGDGCVEWSDITACGASQTCTVGSCSAQAGANSPAKIGVIPTVSAGSGSPSSSSPASVLTVSKSVGKMTRAEILARINEIIALIAKLQEQLKAITGKVAYSCTQITNNLYYGMKKDPQVKCLQEILKAQGFAVVPTGDFGGITKTAVKQFQEKYASEILAPYGLKYGSGNVGSATKNKLNKIIGGN